MMHNIELKQLSLDTPKRIYEEGGFRITETRKAGRAVFEAY